jgi:GAF domain-containing protein
MAGGSSEALLAELARVASALSAAVVPPGTERLLEALTETARRLFGARACSLALLSDDEAELVYTTAAGAGADDVTGMRLPANRGVAGWVVQSGQPVAVGDLRNDPRFAVDVAESLGYVPEAMLAAPVVSERGVLGVLSLLDRDAARPDAEQDMALLQVFCDQAAIALEGRRAFNDLGRVLLTLLALAAGDHTELGTAARRLADDVAPGDADLAALAGLFAALARYGAAERRLAVRLVTDVLDHLDAAPRRRSAPSGR